jgi:DNA-binding CsgD family transcriptional regulator
MEHLLIAYDILAIIVGFIALSNAVSWALRTGENDMGNFSIVYALYTLMLIVVVLKKYLFVNVDTYTGWSWYTISGIYQVLDFAVVVATLHYFLDAHQFRHGRRVAAVFLFMVFVCSALIFSPFGATLDVDKNIIHFGMGYWIAIGWNAVAFTCAMVLGCWLLIRQWKTEKRTFTMGLMIFASAGYLESVFGFLQDFGTTSVKLTAERGFLYSSIPYVLYGFFLIVYFVRRPIPAPKGSEEPTAEFIAKYGITERERELILKVMQGKSNADIARELFISLPTVKTHLHNIYQKLGVDSRYDLLARVRSGQ